MGVGRLMSGAVSTGRERAVSLLLGNAVTVDATDICGDTPLLPAAEEGLDRVMALLLGRGATVDAINSLRLTTLSLAAENGHGEA